MDNLKVFYTPKNGIIGISSPDRLLLDYSNIKSLIIIEVIMQNGENINSIIIIKSNVEESIDDTIKEFISTYKENYKSHKIVSIIQCK